MLLEVGADLHRGISFKETKKKWLTGNNYERSTDNVTPLIWAVVDEDENLANMLIAAGADVNRGWENMNSKRSNIWGTRKFMDNENISPLEIAIKEGHAEIERILKNAGARSSK